jgi:sigma-B regulation protein RsbU (phosphoserine phosphatase)
MTKKVNFYHSLAFRLCLYVFLCTSLIVSGIMWYLHTRVQRVMQESVSQVVERLNEETASRITALLSGMENATESLKRTVEHGYGSPEEVQWSIKNLLSMNPELFYGSAVAFKPGSYYGTNMAFYSYWKDGELVETNLNDPSYNYPVWEWFRIPEKELRPNWSEPYFDIGGGNASMCTYSVPFFQTEPDGTDTFMGVVTADMGLLAVQKIINRVRVYDTGFAMLVSEGGKILVLPEHERNEGGLFSADLVKRQQEDLENLAVLVKSQKDTVGRIDGFISSSGEKVWLYLSQIQKSGWSILFVVTEAEVLDDLDDVRHIAAQSFILGLVVLLLTVLWISKRFTHPIAGLAEETGEIAKGNLDISIQRHGRRDEIDFLSSSIDNMRMSLKEYIASLGRSLVQQERITSELKIATHIQMSFLTRNFDIPGVDNVEIHALLEPAKEVGGDLYTFFRMDDKRLFFAVGDVSGKGVPAALFMAVTLTLMKGMQYQKVSPAGILKRVGHELALQNEHTMFVTVFCGILDTETGSLEYSNAGHLPPVLLKEGVAPRWLDLPKGIVLGISNYPIYEDRCVQLNCGETVVIYTDGVNEAMNREQQLFGEERLLACLANKSTESVSAITASLCSSVHQYAGEEPQSDDITVMALRYKRP